MWATIRLNNKYDWSGSLDEGYFIILIYKLYIKSLKSIQFLFRLEWNHIKKKFCMPISFNNLLITCFSNILLPDTNYRSIFLIEKSVLHGLLKIIGAQNQLPIIFVQI